MTNLPNLPPNPYIIGRPIREPKNFFGREYLFSLIADSLPQNAKLILLYGQRRIGKSSVLNLIPQKIGSDEFIFINFDFQDKEKLSNNQILSDIAQKILEKLELPQDNNDVLEHLAENIQQDFQTFHREFLPQVYLNIGNKKIVLLWDEFDVLTERENEQETGRFLEYIIHLLNIDQRLFIIPVVGRHINRLETLVSFFKQATYKEIALLDKESTQRLITKPAEGILTYQPETIDTIFNICAGSPYFTQVICHTIYGQVRDNYRINPNNDLLTITPQNVENVINQAIEAGKGGLAWFWDGLNLQQQIIIAAAAEAQEMAIINNQSVIEEPLTLLTNAYSIVITQDLKDAYEQLFEYGFLDETKRRVKIEFVRLWLVKEHRLKDEITNLDKINQENVSQLLSVADRLRQNNPEGALSIYQQAFKLNPNNFRGVISLAQEYLNIQNIDEASNLYKRAYQFYSKLNHHQQELIVQPLLTLAQQKSQAQDYEQALEICTMAYEIDSEQSKDILIEVREDYGHELILNRQWVKAEEQFTLVLQIDDNRKSSKHKLAEIQTLKSRTDPKVGDKNPASVNINTNQISTWLNWGLRFGGFLGGLAIIFLLGFGGYTVFFSKPCPTGEKKEFGFWCVVDNSRISRGDRIFFPNIINRFRDQGIQAFKKGDYQQAEKLFKQAVEANQNDPEVLIYYNNSLALQQGSPFTFAVVVPIDNTSTSNGEEILRGVAAAQNQFNQNTGLNGRLLEIVIANDGNTEYAEQVAQQLAKDDSILGVIGHNSSDATKIALPVYEKAELPIISATSTSVLLNNPVFFRSVYSDESAGQKLGEYAYKQLKLKTAVIFANPNSPYSNSIREVFTNTFEKLGGKVVRKPLIDLTATTFDPEKEVAKSVYTDKAEAALLFPSTDKPATDEAINIAKEITNRNARLKTQDFPIKEVKMLAGDTLYNYDPTIVRGGKDVEGLIIAIPWFRGTSAAEDFAKKSKELWGGDVSWRTATSYDATQAFIKALALSPNASRTTILENLQQVNLPANETSGYPFQFTDDRERQGESILVKVQNGKFVEIESR
ncbi:ABC transporter substrate-binding protein [Sphaerospermopsis sp. FACHB-1094]|uniref:ABC transporter substrate-binding protein n=1 Tax=Sphaerospermopsis sp. FACHB-1094 TaxID=2692861 RepID=UPI0016850713|nr:ABC transporter substrate-binding protein [Sphaerospermopsis sp. FACHB-1094]MBD2133870.1 ABC transporter substrate-binding protein [Sphaerospermopsis sp. FACHB-1094]